MTNYFDEDTIRQYIQEYTSLDYAIETLKDRQNTIDDILRNEYRFVIGKDRLLNA